MVEKKRQIKRTHVSVVPECIDDHSAGVHATAQMPNLPPH